MKGKINIRAIVLFYVIAVAFRFAAVKTALLEQVNDEYLKILLRGIGPAVGAVVSFAVFQIPSRLSLKGIYNSFMLPFALYWALPAAFTASVYYLHNGRFPIVLMFTVLVYGLLEEIGWRGFLQQQLKLLPKIYSITLIAILWFSWHLNFDLNTSNLIFFGIIFLGSWGIGKVYDKTASLLAVAGVHSLNNFFRNGLHEAELFAIAILLAMWIMFIVWYDKKNGFTATAKHSRLK
ncbi:membrane protease YdiL (CAAX protease family) [Dyadobacter sp. BE34]|uniref:Membrane protease YdiL (CAAX protease family) n=1 Tax=Dyadobacter fermentans TaxID=94254 RepID=A0ABU1R0M7_9BACT|nr:MULTISPECIES: CPBP family intramembrane glutamic endopeptidase [Dyadobacter]MDR6806925.1 membrane protease YdiL (CAAX protease family) [Dyadobacter fermentans]MDR7044667.1 membrane protease YdiL (CAAX protease family) [Dyadobacter sp. BE242]MDR7198977.1 membrane protease YdiL (CAAX protease family) [Dyadobacter sp. BE34]MDR7216939.1 membrane protease YdiL (CAAX protease family) [Dyadobacter sp. BE31]MDR7263535.1 membrane protease YdiL (CAAX protease family) [Dyadobacter sp. BE32]